MKDTQLRLTCNDLLGALLAFIGLIKTQVCARSPLVGTSRLELCRYLFLARFDESRHHLLERL